MIVLDICRGEYFALDPDTSRRWHDFVDGVEPDPSLVAAIDELGWRQSAREKLGRPSPFIVLLARSSPQLLAFACILIARWRLARRGFADAYGWAEAWAGFSGAPRRDAEEYLRLFVRVEGLLPSALGERDCLPRSFALFVYLRALGHAVRHVIGVARFPFDAHAWVELDEKALLEKRAEQKLLPNARTPKGRTPIAVLA